MAHTQTMTSTTFTLLCVTLALNGKTMAKKRSPAMAIMVNAMAVMEHAGREKRYESLFRLLFNNIDVTVLRFRVSLSLEACWNHFRRVRAETTAETAPYRCQWRSDLIYIPVKSFVVCFSCLFSFFRWDDGTLKSSWSFFSSCEVTN